jgi:hypothetical protein
MKIFISWSGQRSKLVAEALAEWLPDVFQNLKTWISDHNIAAGSQWSAELNRALHECGFGILCLTPENQRAPWLLFEAGSIAKALQTARVIPYCFDISPSEIEYPLAQFQGVEATREGTRRILQSLNRVHESPLSENRLKRAFETWWPSLEKKLNDIQQPVREYDKVQTKDGELLQNIWNEIKEMRIIMQSQDVSSEDHPARYSVSNGKERKEKKSRIRWDQRFPIHQIPFQQRPSKILYYHLRKEIKTRRADDMEMAKKLFAEKTGISLERVSEILKGDLPASDEVNKMLKSLNWSLFFLFGVTESDLAHEEQAFFKALEVSSPSPKEKAIFEAIYEELLRYKWIESRSS